MGRLHPDSRVGGDAGAPPGDATELGEGDAARGARSDFVRGALFAETDDVGNTECVLGDSVDFIASLNGAARAILLPKSAID